MSKKGKSYSTFKNQDIQNLGIGTGVKQLFLENIRPVEASDFLKKNLQRNLKMPVITEKAKSEFIVAPILTEIMENNPDKFTCFSGISFDVDSSFGLRGRSDFILSKIPHSLMLESPIFSIIEAKNDGIEDAYPQCIAQLYAAEIFNKRHNTPFPFLYGAVTTGFLWKFIRFENNTASVDTEMFYMDKLDELLGVLQFIIDEFN